jgi:sporulation-control protein spo0M
VKLLDDNTSIDMPPVWYRGSPVTGKLSISDASIQKYAKMIVQLKYGGRFYVGGRAQSIHGAITQNEMYNAVKSEFKLPPAGSTGPNGFTNLDFTINLPGTIPISISNMRVLVYYKMKVTLVTRPGRGDNHVQKIDVTVA